MTINIKDITNSSRAVSALDGDIVFLKIIDSFEKKQPVLVDFSEIELTITAFLNASIGKLYSVYDVKTIREFLSIENLHQDEMELLKFVIEKAKERFGKNDNNIDLLNEA